MAMAALRFTHFNSRDNVGSLTDPSLIAAVVLVSVIGASILASFTILLLRYVQRKRRSNTQPDVASHHYQPPLLSPASTLTIKESSMTSLDTHDLPAAQTLEPPTMQRTESRNHGDIMTDWKEFEANLKTHASLSLKNHPGLRQQPPPQQS